MCPLFPAISCPDLADPTDGSVVLTDGTNVDSSATYSCDEGFALYNGDHSRTCHLNAAEDAATWDGQAPECLRKQTYIAVSLSWLSAIHL